MIRNVDRLPATAQTVVAKALPKMPPSTTAIFDAAASEDFRRKGPPVAAELRKAILEAVAPKGVFERETGFITSLRHEQLLRESAAYLAKAREAVLSGIPHEMLLLDLYAALGPIDSITGATTADDILNRIFSTFCIGK